MEGFDPTASSGRLLDGKQHFLEKWYLSLAGNDTGQVPLGGLASRTSARDAEAHAVRRWFTTSVPKQMHELSSVAVPCSKDGSSMDRPFWSQRPSRCSTRPYSPQRRGGRGPCRRARSRPCPRGPGGHEGKGECQPYQAGWHSASQRILDVVLPLGVGGWRFVAGMDAGPEHTGRGSPMAAGFKERGIQMCDGSTTRQGAYDKKSVEERVWERSRGECYPQCTDFRYLPDEGPRGTPKESHEHN